MIYDVYFISLFFLLVIFMMLSKAINKKIQEKENKNSIILGNFVLVFTPIVNTVYAVFIAASLIAGIIIGINKSINKRINRK